MASLVKGLHHITALTDVWHDVKSAGGAALTFQDEGQARAKLEELYPLLVKLERFASGPKRTRVIIVNPYQDVDAERDK